MRLPGMGPGTQTSLSALGPVWLSVSESVYQGLFSRNVVPLKERKTCRFKKRAEREKDGNRIIRSNTTKPDRHRPNLSVRPVQSTMPQLSIPIGAAHVSFHFHFPTFPPAPKDVHVPRVLTVLYSSVSSVCNEAISASACGARSFRTLMLTKPRRQPGNSSEIPVSGNLQPPNRTRRGARRGVLRHLLAARPCGKREWNNMYNQIADCQIVIVRCIFAAPRLQ